MRQQFQLQMTKNRTPTPVYLDPGMHPGLEVKGLKPRPAHISEVADKTLSNNSLLSDILSSLGKAATSSHF